MYKSVGGGGSNKRDLVRRLDGNRPKSMSAKYVCTQRCTLWPEDQRSTCIGRYGKLGAQYVHW